MPPQTLFALLPYGVLIAGCICAAVTDVRLRRIPDAVPIALLIAGVVLHAFAGPLPALMALGTAFVVAFAGSMLFSQGWLGGGDVKLIAAACSLFSPLEDLHFVLYVTIGGGLLAIITAAVQGRLREMFTGVFTILHLTHVDHSIVVAPRTSVSLPYAIAITFGALTLAAMHTFPFAMRAF